MLPDVGKTYRSTADGELGTLIERDGKLYIKLNRPREELLRPFLDGSQWIPEVERRPLSKAQLGKVCFDADVSLCRALGIHGATQKTWLDLTDKQRIAWMEVGPQKDPERKALWEAINCVMEPLTR